MAEAFGFPFRRTVNFTGAYSVRGDDALPILESQLFEGGLALTATNYTNASTFGAHTVTPGAVTLTATLYVNPNTFGAATVALSGGPQSLTATRYADPDTFGAATVAATYSLTATRFADADTFGAHTVTPGAVTLTATRFADGDTFGAATVASGPVTLTATLFADGDTFGSPTIAGGAVTLSPTLFVDGDSFGSATIAEGDQPTEDARQPGGFLPVIYVDRNGRPVDLKKAAETVAEDAPEQVQEAAARVVEVIQNDDAAVTDAIARDFRTVLARMEELDAALAELARLEFDRIRQERVAAALAEIARLQAEDDDLVTILMMAA